MMRQLRATPLLMALAVVLLLAGTAGAAPQEMGDMEGGEAMAPGSEACAACHPDVVSATLGGPHAAVERDGERFGVSSSCAGCHGDGTEHMEAGGDADLIFSFDEENPHTVNAGRCMECHGDAHPQFFRSPHAKAGLSCQECHSIHEPAEGDWALLKASDVVERPMENLSVSTKACAECHQDVFAQFEFNERHRLQEGILECASCHNPHEPATRTNLGGFKQEQCAECHTDKSGPFVFEHGASRVEGCVACHTPHGSPNRHLLKFQNVAELCYSCHVAIPGFHSRFTLESQCTNCHSTIHGSNFDQFFLK